MGVCNLWSKLGSAFFFGKFRLFFRVLAGHTKWKDSQMPLSLSQFQFKMLGKAKTINPKKGYTKLSNFPHLHSSRHIPFFFLPIFLWS